MNQIQTFDFQGYELRTVLICNEPWFVAKDVCEILGLNTSEAVRGRKDRDFKDGLDLDEYRDDIDIVDTIGRRVKVIAVNESGLYNLIFKSRKPEAKRFKRWVTHEVLPSIRKHGAYMTPKKIEEVLLNPDTIIQLATTLKEERQKRLEAEKTIEQQKPKVLFADAVETSESSILIGELAKILRQNGIDIGQNRLFQWLRENGYLCRQRGEQYNLPTQYSMDLGLFEIKKRTINNPDGSVRVTRTPKVTGKGQIYFVNKFLDLKKVN